jgi:hypothetical protein
VALLSLAACGDDDKNNTQSDAQTGAPVITNITWNPGTGCTMNVAGEYSFGITAMDDTTPTASLKYNLTVTGCSGDTWDETKNTGVLTCPNHMNYPGTASVTDMDNKKTMKTFTVQPCHSGSQQ